VSGTHQREGLGTPSSLDIYLYPLEAADIETVVVALTEIVVVIVGIAHILASSHWVAVNYTSHNCFGCLFGCIYLLSNFVD
jgi:hypothetical protein